MLIRGRRLYSRHPGRLVGVFPSLTTGLSMPYESGLERDFLRLCDFDPSIRDFRSQPFRLRYWMEDRERSYTPDMLIGANRLIEVKPESRTRKPEFRAWVTAVRAACVQMGYEFEVVTDAEIRRQPRLDNVVLLRRYHYASLSVDAELSVSAWVREKPGITFGELLEQLGNDKSYVAGLYGLLARHAVRFDVHRPLGPHLPIFPLDEEER